MIQLKNILLDTPKIIPAEVDGTVFFRLGFYNSVQRGSFLFSLFFEHMTGE